MASRFILGGLAVAGVVAVSSAPAAGQRAPFSIARPAEGGWGSVVLAIVDHNRARLTGNTYCPPGMEPDELCLGAEIVEGSAEIVRYLSARPEGWRDPGPFPRIRFVGRHAVRWIDAGRRLAILEQTANPYLFRVWAVSAENDFVCLPQQVVVQFRIQTRFRHRNDEEQQTCFRLSALE